MKKMQIDTIAFLLIISILGIANFAVINKPEVSELENRALKKKPDFTLAALADGSFFTDYNEYYNDTFIFRDNILQLSSNIQQSMFFSGSDVKIIVSDKSKEYNTAPDNQNTDESSNNQKNPESTNEGINIEEPQESPQPIPTQKQYNESDGVGYWLVIDGKAVELFKFNKESFNYYADVLNEYYARLGNKMPIYSLIAPTNSEFVQLRQYKGITDSQNNAIGYLSTKFTNGITAVNAYDILNEHKDEYIYFRSDHHWTALGAYYAYRAFMETKGEEPVPLENYEEVKIDNFLGSTYAKTRDKSIEKNPDTIYAYKPFVKYKYEMHHYNECDEAEIIDMKYADTKLDKYLVFLSSGDSTWAVISTDKMAKSFWL